MSVVIQSILWSVLGAIACRERIVKPSAPKLLGSSLYWIGIPLQIFVLARKSNFEQMVWLPPIVALLVLALGLALVLSIPPLFKQIFFDRDRQIVPVSNEESEKTVTTPYLEGIEPPAIAASKPTAIVARRESEGLLVKLKKTSLATQKAIYQNLPLPKTSVGVGSLILASILCNTGSIDLILIPPLVDFEYWNWIVLYGIAHHVLGSYGLGILIANHYSHSRQSHSRKRNWLSQLQHLLFLPSLWAFVYGYTSRNLILPNFVEIAISQAVLLIAPAAFILIGMQLSQLQQWQSLRLGAFPALVKMLILPMMTGLLLTYLGMEGDSRLVLVLMAGMPTAFSSVILTEEYDLDRQIVASSILLSTLFLPIVILLWLVVF